MSWTSMVICAIGLLVLDHRKITSPKFFYRKAISTESPFNWTPFEQKFIILSKGHMTDFFFREWSFDRIYFRQKMSLDRNSFDWKFIWLKVFSENDHLMRFKMRKAFPILMMNQGCFTFCQKLFRSNDHFPKKNIRSNDYFSKKTFGQINFRSNDL
jgi:hypothetical protein